METTTQNLEPLTFRIAPHIVEDLGLNLYTDLPRVLCEYVANAYDADAEQIHIIINKSGIEEERQKIRQEYRAAYTEWQSQKSIQGNSVEVPTPLSDRRLGDEFSIVISDNGHGMNRKDLQKKFLVAGRRRRIEDKDAFSIGKRRPLMGRKGLGKLAGFGVARKIKVCSKVSEEKTGQAVELNFEELINAGDEREVNVKTETWIDPEGKKSGTTVILSGLLFEPLKSKETTLIGELLEHFEYIDPGDFKIFFNDDQLIPRKPDFSFAWPEPDEDVGQFIAKALEVEDSEPITFTYRLRFTADNKALGASRRGIRIYSHKRLAANPSLLDADTNMHGFRMTDYLDGVVHADFIDDQPIDYIATDRQSLRWDSPLLKSLRDFLSKEIKKACAEYQKTRDGKAPGIVKEDLFTRKVIEEDYGLSGKNKTMAYKIASALYSGSKEGVEDRAYKEKLPVLVKSIGQGEIYSAILELSQKDSPRLNEVAVEAIRLTHDEYKSFLSYAKARINAVNALTKIVESTDFKDKDNEKDIQNLLEECPWLIDPTFTQFITGDKPYKEMFNALSRELKINKHGSSEDEKRRPDLVFLLGNESLSRILIVELKSANKPLCDDHLNQLKAYLTKTKKWLQQEGKPSMNVHGYLIGTLPKVDSTAEGADGLRYDLEHISPNSEVKIYSYLELLIQTKKVHADLLEQFEGADIEDDDV